MRYRKKFLSHLRISHKSSTQWTQWFNSPNTKYTLEALCNSETHSMWGIISGESFQEFVLVCHHIIYMILHSSWNQACCQFSLLQIMRILGACFFSFVHVSENCVGIVQTACPKKCQYNFL